MNLMIAILLLAGGDDVLVADFEGKDYGAWTTTGTAFGTGPARSTLPNQMPVGGFLGKGLANSYLGGDAATGTLTSPPFKIERRYLNFLIGGGNRPGDTAVNLLLDGKVVRSATGRDSEMLDSDGWDVGELAGKSVALELVDRATGGWGHINLDHVVQSDVKAGPRSRDVTISARYLQLPVRTGQPKKVMKLVVDDVVVREFDIELAERDPQFWAVVDVGAWKGKTLRMEASSPAIEQVGQVEVPPPADDPQRPAFHFTSQRGWLNDPNGMVYAQGEWHLYYQHNPYGWAWGNMHWGHTVSKDLLHWEELPIAIYPRKYGDWAFSGSAVVDRQNTSGWKTGTDDLLVGAYTSTGRGECMVYSNDRGRTWTEFAGNPVVKHSGRDPRLLWHAASKQWVMAVYTEEGKKQLIAFYTSPDLKAWTFRSKIDGYYECPDLFELDGKWVLLAADGKYVLGGFDGATFVPDGPKQTLWHGAFYASQTFSDAPDGRRIQVGWARGADFPGRPFNQQMNLPVELTLKRTPDGPRLRAVPVKELEQRRAKKHEWKGELKPGENPLAGIRAELADVDLAFRPGTAERVTLELRGVSVTWDGRREELRCRGLSFPLKPVDGVIRLRAIVDRGSIELFANDGLVAACVPCLPSRSQTLFKLSSSSSLEVDLFELDELQ